MDGKGRGKNKGENAFLGCLVGRENMGDFGKSKVFSYWDHKKLIISNLGRKWEREGGKWEVTHLPSFLYVV